MAAAVTVVSAVLGALTLVPALLGLIGGRIDRYRVRRPVAETRRRRGLLTPQGTWHRYAQRVERHPWRFLAAGVTVVVVLAIPVLSLQLGHIGDGADPKSFTDRRAYDLMTDAFGPGSNGPLTVVIDQTSVPSSERDHPLLAGAEDPQRRRLGAATAHPAPTPPRTATSSSPRSTPKQSPQSADTTDLTNRLGRRHPARRGLRHGRQGLCHRDDRGPGRLPGTSSRADCPSSSAWWSPCPS